MLPMTWKPLTFFAVTLAGWINRQQQEVIEYLRMENRILREKLGHKRLILNDCQKRRLATAAMKMGKDGMTLHVGAVDDESWVWLNGRLLGEVTKATNPKDYYSVPREYQIKEDMLHRDGENVLVVRVNNTYLTGGILGSPRLLTPAPWLGSYYLQTPLAGDDPYRYYRW